MSISFVTSFWRSAPPSFRGVAGRVLLFTGLLAVEGLVFREVYSLQVTLCLLAFLLLISSKRDRFENQVPLSPPSGKRLFTFFFLHAATILLVLGLIPSPQLKDGPLWFAPPLLHLTPLLTLFALASWQEWRAIGRVAAPEVVASLVVLFTIFPDRIAVFLWEAGWRTTLVHSIYAALSLFFNDAVLVTRQETIIGTVRYAARVIYPCSGIGGIYLFQELFGLMLLLDWKRLSPKRVLVVYVCGLFMMQVANMLRITAFLALGTVSSSAGLVELFHQNIGWIADILAFTCLMVFSYRWMLGSTIQAVPARVGPELQTRTA